MYSCAVATTPRMTILCLLRRAETVYLRMMPLVALIRVERLRAAPPFVLAPVAAPHSGRMTP